MARVIHFAKRLLLTGVAAFFIANGIGAQSGSTSAPQQQPPTISVRVDLVRVAVTVTDAKGNFIRDLRREDFRLLDEGAEQRILYFASAEEPARVLVLVEASPAVYLIAQQHLIAAHLLFDGLAPDDEVALATYSNAAALRAGFSTDKRAARQAMLSPQFSLGSGELNLFDSLAAVMTWLNGSPGKKSLVLLSTGLDAGPPSRWDALVRVLRASDTSVYTVALGAGLREADSTKKKKKKVLSEQEAFVAAGFAQAATAMKEIAQITGGRAFSPREAADFADIYRQIATALRNQYSLGFNSDATDGRYRKLEVLLPAEESKKPEQRKIFARKGYIAPMK